MYPKMPFLKKIILCWQIQLLKRGTFKWVKNQHERRNKLSTQGKVRYLCLAVWYTLVPWSHGILFLLLPAPELLNFRTLLPLSTFFSSSPVFWHKLLRYHFWWKFTHVIFIFISTQIEFSIFLSSQDWSLQFLNWQNSVHCQNSVCWQQNLTSVLLTKFFFFSHITT